MIGEILAILALASMVGMIIVPIIPYLQLKVDDFKKEEKKQPPYEILY